MKPKISFTFPYRWLVDPEDRKFLGKNLLNQARNNGLSMESPNLTAIKGTTFTAAYAIILYYLSYEPVDIPITKEELAKIFKPLFPGAKLLDFRKKFKQVESPTALPVMQIDLFY